MSTTTASAVCVLAMMAMTWFLADGQGEPTSVQIDTMQPADNLDRTVNIEALRDRSIAAYTEGGNEGNLEDAGLKKKDMTISMVVGILIWGLIMICCSVQCEKYLMRDFYKLQRQQLLKENQEIDAQYNDGN